MGQPETTMGEGWVMSEVEKGELHYVREENIEVTRWKKRDSRSYFCKVLPQSFADSKSSTKLVPRSWWFFFC